jgi:hypothetical protein
MSFSKNFLYDIFISYASVNDQPDGLISTFRDQLEHKLQEKGIREELSIYFDKTRLENGRQLDNQLLDAAKSAAVMVVFHSPAYDASPDWCHREYREFVEWNGNLDGRFFLIAIDGEHLPATSPVFGRLSRHSRPFFTQKGSHFFRFSPSKPDYENSEGYTFTEEIGILADEIARNLKQLRDDSTTRRVFLTCAETFQIQAKNLKATLTDRGFLVLQTSPWLEKDVRLAHAKDLISRSELVVGIEESFRGVEQREPSAHALEQEEIAKRLNKARLRWLPSEHHGFTDLELAELKKSSDVVAASLEDFKRLILARLTAPSTPVLTQLVENKGAAPSLALLICASDDEAGALNDLFRKVDLLAVGRDGYVDSSLIADPAAIEAWRREVKEMVKNFNHSAVIFVDGCCRRDWIDTRLRNYLVLERDLVRTPKAAVWDYHPIPKSEMRHFRPVGRVTLLRHDDEPALRAFLLQ